MTKSYREPQGRVNKRPMMDLIIDHLRDKGSITSLEAAANYRCRALPRRIADLKVLGYDIKSERKQDDVGQWYVRYQLVGSKLVGRMGLPA